MMKASLAPALSALVLQICAGSASLAQTAGSTVAPVGEAVVIAGERDGFLVLGDGRLLGLAGVERTGPSLSAFFGRPARLLVTGRRDRHGALSGDLLIDTGSLSQTVLRDGLRRFRPRPGDIFDGAVLLAAERAARRAVLGVWSDPQYAIRDCSIADTARDLVGRFGVYQCRVVHIGVRRDVVYLDFGEDWRADVTVRVRGSAVDAILGKDPRGLEGQVVRFRGVAIEAGGPLIDVTEPAAFERVSGNGG